MTRRALALLLPLAATACVHTVYSVATAPVRAVGWTADKLTTSQSEADRNLGRKVRKQREREAKEERKREKEERKAAREQGYAPDGQ